MVFSLRIDDKIKEKIEVLALKNKRSINSEILVAIEKYLEEE